MFGLCYILSKLGLIRNDMSYKESDDDSINELHEYILPIGAGF